MRLNFLVGLSLAIFILAWSPAQASYTMEATFSADNITNYIYLEEISDNSNRDFASASLTNRADWRKSDTLTIDNLEFGKTYRMYFAFENLDQADPGNPENGESDPMGFIAKLVIDDLSIVTDADWQWDEFSHSDDPGTLFQREAAWENVHAYLDGDKYWNAYNWGYASNDSE
jgi:hypothetical protein